MRKGIWNVIFLFLHKNIFCGYSLEVPCEISVFFFGQKTTLFGAMNVACGAVKGMGNLWINPDFWIEKVHIKHKISLLYLFTRPYLYVKSSYLG